MRAALVTLTVCLLVLPASAKYSGGTGEPNDPYQIATAADLIALGETSEDYDKHFILTADIDLDPNLPGRKVFDKAVIRSGETFFTGVFDGNVYTIRHMTIEGKDNLGLFACVYQPGKVKNLRIVDVVVTGSGDHAGSLIAINLGGVTNCSSTGAVSGRSNVGSLVGANGGSIASSYSTGSVSGIGSNVGGLVGYNSSIIFLSLPSGAGSITTSYSGASVSGSGNVGGLAGCTRDGRIASSCSSGPVSGTGNNVGGLVGYDIDGSIVSSCSGGSVSGYWLVGGLVGCSHGGALTHCYSTGAINGERWVGGLVGSNEADTAVTASFWDTQTSRQTTSAGGTGQTTAEMQTAKTFLDAAWDFVGETANGTEDIWKIAEGLGYPRLAWEKYSGGTGEPNDPYQIATAADLIALGETPEDYDKHFVLTADIDLDPNLPGRRVFDKAVIGQVVVVEDPNSLSVVGAPFAGVFDGNDHTISHLTITSGACVGLFGCLDSGAEVKNLAVVDVNITTRVDFVGSLVGCNFGRVAKCHGTGTLSGRYHVGGLVGLSYSGTLTACSSISAVSGVDRVGGLVGHNGTQYRYDRPRGSVSQCYSAGRVTGTRWGAGGLAGSSDAAVTQCYSTSEVSGGIVVGGLVGCNYMTVTQCYSAGSVTGNDMVGGLTGLLGTAEASFWDTRTSGQTTSAGGTGKTTAQMQTARTFLDAAWDFVGETDNGTEDIWWIDEGMGYPHLWWELTPERQAN
jgi:hypothetical protein